MKLVLVVVERSDADGLADRLVQAGYPVTKLGSSGGFLRRHSTTLLSGVPDEKVDDVLTLIREQTRGRTELVPAQRLPLLGALDLAHEPVEVRRGGAVVWVLPVERFERF